MVCPSQFFRMLTKFSLKTRLELSINRTEEKKSTRFSFQFFLVVSLEVFTCDLRELNANQMKHFELP